MIDIMLPFYGDPALMRATVRSVLAQDDPGWRLTVVDDAYPGESVEGWLAGLDDSRVRYVRNPRNLGINRNFQRCIELAENPRMVMIGGDDLLLPHYVRTVGRIAAEHPDVAMIQPGVVVVDDAGRPALSLVDRCKAALRPRAAHEQVLAGESLVSSLLRGNWLYFPSICWRTETVRRVGFREGFDVVQDLALVLDLLERGEQLVLNGTPCFEYRRHRASDSSWKALDGSRFDEERQLFRECALRMERHGWHRAARSARWHLTSRLHAVSLLPKAARSGRAADLRRLLTHAVT